MLDYHDIGSKDRLVVLRSPNSTRDAVFNQPVAGWTTVASVWASRLFNRGNEKYIADKEHFQQNYTYLIGFDSSWSDINPNWTLSDNSVDYEITEVTGDERLGYFIIKCVRKV